MKLIISASHAFAKWFKLDFPCLPSPDGEKIGTQPLLSNSNTLAWQCHVIKGKPRSQGNIVIAVEAYSRYTLLMPCLIRPSQAGFESMLERRWGEDIIHRILESGTIPASDVSDVFEQFTHTPKQYFWCKNTDLSVNTHVINSEQWIKDALDQFMLNRLGEEEASRLDRHINEQFKHTKGSAGTKTHSSPVTRMLNDALFRFAAGLAQQTFPKTAQGDFPAPYKHVPTAASAKVTEASHDLPVPGNVTSMAAYRKRK